MKWLRFILIIIVSAAAGLAFGFLLRGRETHAVHFVSHGEKASSNGKTTKLSGVQISPGTSSPVSNLERNLAFSTGVTRWLYWMEALETATTNDMPRLAHLALSDPNALKMVALRWFELSPRHFFDTLVKGGANGSDLVDPLGYNLLDEWIKRDPAALIAALEEAQPFGARGQWRNHVAGSVIQTDAELGLSLFEKWRDDRYTPNMGGVEKWAAANPRHAAEFTMAHPGGNVSEAAAEVIGRVWAKTDPASALEFAGSKTGQLTSLLANAALKTWAERNLSEAAEWLAKTDGTTRARLAAPFVEAWAAKDPASALIWSEANLTGSSLAAAAGGILKQVADTDVSAAARLVTAMQPSSARAQGAIAVVEKWMPRFDSTDRTKEEATRWLASLDSDSIRRVLEKAALQWGQSDPAAMARFLSSTPVEHIDARVYETVANNLARTDPAGAVEWASTVPEDARAQAGGAAFTEWRRSQPDAALDWWNKLPAADPRRKSFLERALRDFAALDRNTGQFAALASLDPPLARSIIQKWVPPDRQRPLLDAIGISQNP